MQYSVAHFRYSFTESWQQDLFLQTLGDLGFDAFDEDSAYIPTATLLTQQKQLLELIDRTHEVQLLSIDNCPNEDWNATWEEQLPIQELPLGVHIVPHCAFGTGYHQTTAMMIQALLQRQHHFHSVLDMGCGTGVLAVMAAKCGADKITAVDIDDNSVLNAQQNAARNAVTIDVRLGSTPPAGQYDLIMANIHRNTLIQQLPEYAQYLAPNGEVWMSGFYEEDIPPVLQAANSVGLILAHTEQMDEWRMLQFTH